MSYHVDISDQAVDDVRQAHRWIALRDRRAANRWQASLLAAIDSLVDQPERYALAPEEEWYNHELRQMLFGKRARMYRILFVILNDVVHIMTVRHAAQAFLEPGDLEQPGM